MFGSFFGGGRDEVEDLPNSWDRHRRTQEVKKEPLLNSILITPFRPPPFKYLYETAAADKYSSNVNEIQISLLGGKKEILF